MSSQQANNKCIIVWFTCTRVILLFIVIWRDDLSVSFQVSTTNWNWLILFHKFSVSISVSMSFRTDVWKEYFNVKVFHNKLLIYCFTSTIFCFLFLFSEWRAYNCLIYIYKFFVSISVSVCFWTAVWREDTDIMTNLKLLDSLLQEIF